MQENPLEHLPCSRVTAFRRGQAIYDRQNRPAGLYVVIAGLVKVTRTIGPDSEIVIDFCRPGDFFGQFVALYEPHISERVTALTGTQVVAWTPTEIEGLVAVRPKLGIALVQIAVRRTRRVLDRLNSLSGDDSEGRLGRSLLLLGQNLGMAREDGSVSLFPLTHETLAQYAGAPRESVGALMARFRRSGCVRYSRQGIVLYPEQLHSVLAGMARHARPAASRVRGSAVRTRRPVTSSRFRRTECTA